jgi:hypothetical protein
MNALADASGAPTGPSTVGAARLEVHFDAARSVEKATWRQSPDRNRCRQTVCDVEHVEANALSHRAHRRSCDEFIRRFHEVGSSRVAPRQSCLTWARNAVASRPRSCRSTNRDRRHAPPADSVGQLQAVHEVRRDADYLKVKMPLRHRGQLLAQERRRNVDCNVLRRPQHGEEPFGLGTVARAEVDQRDSRTDRVDDVTEASREDRLLIARQRILRQFADRLEKARTEGVKKFR